MKISDSAILTCDSIMRKCDATDFSNMTTATLRNMIPGLTEKSVPTKKQAEAELARRQEKKDASRDQINDLKRAITSHKNAVASIEKHLKYLETHNGTPAEFRQWNESLRIEKSRLEEVQKGLANLT